MLDVLTVQEIELESRSRVLELEAQFQERFNAPIIQAQLVQMVLETPEAAETLKQSDPAMYARVMKQIARMQAIFRRGGD